MKINNKHGFLCKIVLTLTFLMVSNAFAAGATTVSTEGPNGWNSQTLSIPEGAYVVYNLYVQHSSICGGSTAWIAGANWSLYDEAIAYYGGAKSSRKSGSFISSGDTIIEVVSEGCYGRATIDISWD